MPPKLKSKTDRTARTKTDRTARTKTVKSGPPTADEFELAHGNLVQTLRDTVYAQFDMIGINDRRLPAQDLTLSDLLDLAPDFEALAIDAADLYRDFARQIRLDAAHAQRICNALAENHDAP